jgi:hypothetical protein
MEVSEYKRRRNENVARKAEELRLLLASSGGSESRVNEAILLQATLSISRFGAFVHSGEPVIPNRREKPSTTTLQQSLRNVTTDLPGEAAEHIPTVGTVHSTEVHRV